MLQWKTVSELCFQGERPPSAWHAGASPSGSAVKCQEVWLKKWPHALREGWPGLSHCRREGGLAVPLRYCRRAVQEFSIWPRCHRGVRMEQSHFQTRKVTRTHPTLFSEEDAEAGPLTHGGVHPEGGGGGYGAVHLGGEESPPFAMCSGLGCPGGQHHQAPILKAVPPKQG